MVHWLRVRSVSDVVTNSSTEVFVVKLTDEIEKALESIPTEVQRLGTDKARKQFVFDHFYDEDLCKLCPFLRSNPILCEQHFKDEDIDEGSWFDDMWNKYRDAYEPLKDCVYLVSSAYGNWPLATREFIDHAKSTKVIL